MRVNENGIRVRFIESDFLRNKLIRENKYISEESIELILSEQNNLCDVTMIFVPYKSGFASRFVDNHTGCKITLDDLNPFAFDFYINQTQLISVMQEKARMALKEELTVEQRVDVCIKKIKDILYKWDDERKESKKLHAVQ